MGSRRGVAVSSTKNSSSSSSSRPLPHECVAVCDALALLHGRPSLKRDQPRTGCEIQEPHTVLDSLVSTLSPCQPRTRSQAAHGQQAFACVGCRTCLHADCTRFTTILQNTSDWSRTCQCSAYLAPCCYPVSAFCTMLWCLRLLCCCAVCCRSGMTGPHDTVSEHHRHHKPACFLAAQSSVPRLGSSPDSGARWAHCAHNNCVERLHTNDTPYNSATVVVLWISRRLWDSKARRTASHRGMQAGAVVNTCNRAYGREQQRACDAANAHLAVITSGALPT
jgi:hypothetical protein